VCQRRPSGTRFDALDEQTGLSCAIFQTKPAQPRDSSAPNDPFLAGSFRIIPATGSEGGAESELLGSAEGIAFAGDRHYDLASVHILVIT
jgi:hypothetical protein